MINITCEFHTSHTTHKWTTPYCPTSNGAIERVHCTINNFLHNLADGKGNWDERLLESIITYHYGYNHSPFRIKKISFIVSFETIAWYEKKNSLSGELSGNWKDGNPKFLPFNVGTHVLTKVIHKIVHGPDDFRRTFLLKKAPHNFSIKYNLKFKENRGSPILVFVFGL